MTGDPTPGTRPDPGPHPPAVTGPTPASRMFAAWRRPGRAQLLVAVLLGLLGFSLVLQARSTSAGLSSLRQSDLVALLDTVTQRSARLDAETQDLQSQRDELRSGTDRTAAAERAARDRVEVLGILAGTVPATGPGVRIRVTDPQRRVNAALLLDAVQELRDAGAEAMQVGDAATQVRVVASTSFTDTADGSGVSVDGHALTPPYTFAVIGDAQTMASALDIPGGVLDTLRQAAARGVVTGAPRIDVTALHPVTAPQYARPAPAGTP